MQSTTLSLTTSFQKLSTLLAAAGWNTSDTISEDLYIKNTNTGSTVTIVFSDSEPSGSAGVHLAPNDNVRIKDAKLDSMWLKTSSASSVDVADGEIIYGSRGVGAYSGITDDGSTVTVGEKAVFSKAIVNTPVALTSSATIALDASLGNYFWYVSGHTSTINVTNLSAGQQIRLLIISDGTSRTQTFGTGVTSTGTLATGTDATKGFEVVFTRNGGSTVGVESSRTTALVI